MDTSKRLHIATRIHFALLRQYGEHVEIGSLLKGGAEAREALWVCEASGDAALVALARQLKQVARAERAERDAAKPAAPQDAAWARNTSGFGVSRPIGLDGPAAPASSWLSPSSWLKRAGSAKPPKHH